MASFIPEKKNASLWWRDGVIYQIYPRSFADANGDGIGDLKGIISKLDYLTDLGVSAIWLSPVFPSPDFDFGYDVADYKAIDPKFGTMADYQALLSEAHNRGIRVILDLVLNHTATSHPWFIEARKSQDNPFHDYYLFQPAQGKKRKPNNWISLFTQRSAWEYVPECDASYYHMFAKEQADLNWRNPAVYREMMDVFRFWAEMGTDGFRLDVFNLYFKDAEFRDNPMKWNLIPFHRQEHLYDGDQPEMDKAIRDIRGILDSYPERYVVGETFLSTPEKLVRYGGRDCLNAVFDFTYTHCRWDVRAFREIIRNTEVIAEQGVWPTWVFNNHDVERTASRLGLGESDERLKLAAAMTILLRGTPYLYYGEEIGMRQTTLKREKLMDPVGKNLWPFHAGKDGSRAPMQWNNQSNAGFTSGTPWNEVHPDYPERNVNAQIHDPNSLWTFYRDLIALRRNQRCFQVGNLTLLDEKNDDVLAFARQFGKQRALVLLNFSQLPRTVSLEKDFSEIHWSGSLSNKIDRIAAFHNGKMKMAGEQAIILWEQA